MSRRHQAKKRAIAPDPRYGRENLSKFINIVMGGGKKSVARKIVYGSFALIEKNGKADPLEVFEKALANVKPELEVRSRRVGGGTYQVPVEVSPTRSLALAFRWIHKIAKKRSERTMEERLAKELVEASENRGGAVKRKQDTHKMAESNRAFAHFRW